MSDLPRVGVGVDVHPIEVGRQCWIAGLRWDGVDGCAGHSDGDVVAHAACNALLCAAGLGDLGAAFGTADPRWAGASGIALLAETAHRLQVGGWVIGNVAVQLVASTPHLGTRRDEAQEVLSRAAGGEVTVAAASTDGLGMIGRGEGRAGLATALVARRRSG